MRGVQLTQRPSLLWNRGPTVVKLRWARPRTMAPRARPKLSGQSGWLRTRDPRALCLERGPGGKCLGFSALRVPVRSIRAANRRGESGPAAWVIQFGDLRRLPSCRATCD
jgi:hypothetical protein